MVENEKVIDSAYWNEVIEGKVGKDKQDKGEVLRNPFDDLFQRAWTPEQFADYQKIKEVELADFARERAEAERDMADDPDLLRAWRLKQLCDYSRVAREFSEAVEFDPPRHALMLTVWLAEVGATLDVDEFSLEDFHTVWKEIESWLLGVRDTLKREVKE